ncbi:hypothetical protein [Brevibacillus laterosporus]|uniref:hypothetical protein n=1 Tax=Brevibacillus laterosporus TaxID=1465 RepID=UPI003D1AAADE
MKNIKANVLFLCSVVALFLSISQVNAAPSKVATAQINAWTLATVPEIKLIGSLGNEFEIQIHSTNPKGTEMKIEKATNAEFSSPVVLEDWKPHMDGDKLSFSLQEDEKIFLRIQARNGANEITAFSTPVLVQQTTPQLTLVEAKETSLCVKDDQKYTGISVERKFSVVDSEANTTVFSSDWITADEYEFTNLNSNKSYKVELSVRLKP